MMFFVAELLHFKTFWDNMMPYRTERLKVYNFLVLMNSATKCLSFDSSNWESLDVSFPRFDESVCA